MCPNPLRNIPSVGELLESPSLRRLVDRLNQNTLVSTVRSVLDEVRNEVQHAATDLTLPSVSELAERVARRLAETEWSPLRPVINATGILLHPDLGGAPLAEEAVRATGEIARDYASVELDLSTGQRCRPVAAIEGLLRQLTGGEAATVVASRAGAMMLTLAALARGREIIVSRGQLAEIDGSFRLPHTIAASGAVLREVGTTNRTRPSDYLEAIGEKTAALLLVQASHFGMIGCTESVTLAQLVEIGRRRQVPVLHDIGLGGLVDLEPWGLPGEPTAPQSIQSGADLVLFSGDELLGGPPCGIIVGRRTWIEPIEKHPAAEALRTGKLTLTALAATLGLYRDPDTVRRAIPLLQLLTTSVENLKNRAERLAPQMGAVAGIASSEALPTISCLAAGNLPSRQFSNWAIALVPKQGGVERLAAALRSATPSVVGRIEQERLLLDLRTVLPRQDQDLVAAIEAVGAGSSTDKRLAAGD